MFWSKAKRYVSLVLGSLVICGLLGISAMAGELRHLKMGYIYGAQGHHLAGVVGVEKGFFKEEGVDVELVEYNNGPEVMLHQQAGDVDVSFNGMNVAQIAKSKGIDVIVLASANLEGFELVVAPDIKDLSDLNGKKAASLGLGTTMDGLLMMAEEKYGFKTEHVYIPRVTEMLAYLEKGEISAFTAWDQWGVIAEEKGIGRIALTGHELSPGYQCCVFLSGGALVREEPDTILKLLRGYEKATKWMIDNRDEADLILAEHSGIPLETIKNTKVRITLQRYPSWIERNSSRYWLEFQLQYKRIKAEAVPDVERFLDELIDESFLYEIHGG